MKIVIDARLYGLENAGLGRYVINLIKQIEGLDQKNHYFILLRKKYYQSLRFKNDNISKIEADYRHYSLKEQYLLPLQLIKLKPDFVHFPHFNVPILWWGKQVVTIHDLIKHQSKGKATTTRSRPLYWLKYLIYQGLVKLAVKRANKIIVPSRYWKKELITRYKVKPQKIKVIYEGVDERIEVRSKKYEIRSILRKYQIRKPFVLYTGSLYPHKNVERLVKAVKLLASSYPDFLLRLVVICARTVFYDRFKRTVNKMEARKFVNLVGFVPDKDFQAIYSQAEAFVLPTLLEGFGLIGLEAMALGCPVVCSDIPVLREVYGKAAHYFDPLDEKDIAKKVAEVIGSKQLQKKLKEFGLKQVKKYSWERSARETLKVYQSII